MKKLIKTEFFRLSRSIAFRLLLFASLWMGFFNGYGALARGNGVTGYQVYVMGLKPDLMQAALISMFAASFFCDEFANRTFGLRLCCGYTRLEVFLAKLPAFVTGLLPLALLPVCVSVAVVTVGNGFGKEQAADLTQEAAVLLADLCFRSLTLGSCGVLAATLVKDRIGTFGLGMLGMYILLFMTANNLEGSNTMGLSIGIWLLKTLVMSSVAILIFMRRDLK